MVAELEGFAVVRLVHLPRSVLALVTAIGTTEATLGHRIEPPVVAAVIESRFVAVIQTGLIGRVVRVVPVRVVTVIATVGPRRLTSASWCPVAAAIVAVPETVAFLISVAERVAIAIAIPILRAIAGVATPVVALISEFERVAAARVLRAGRLTALVSLVVARRVPASLCQSCRRGRDGESTNCGE